MIFQFSFVCTFWLCYFFVRFSNEGFRVKKGAEAFLSDYSVDVNFRILD